MLVVAPRSRSIRNDTIVSESFSTIPPLERVPLPIAAVPFASVTAVNDDELFNVSLSAEEELGVVLLAVGVVLSVFARGPEAGCTAPSAVYAGGGAASEPATSITMAAARWPTGAAGGAGEAPKKAAAAPVARAPPLGVLANELTRSDGALLAAAASSACCAC